MVVEPTKAAACVIMGADGRILMGRRNTSLRFMAGHHVFPGGRIDDGEHANRVIGTEDSVHAIGVKAVVREVFEETGLLLVEGALPNADTLRDHRIQLLEEQIDFNTILDAFDVHLDASRFLKAGNWVTPPFGNIRFDTQYYLCHVDAKQEPELIEGELIGLDWLHPGEARRRWHVGEIKLPTPVAYTLHQFASAPFDRAMDLLERPGEREPGVHRRYELRRGIHTVPLETDTIPPAAHTNCIIVGEEELLIIDPGSHDADELEQLESQLDHLVELGGRINAILLTHSHRDHIGGVAHVREKYGIPVWAHRATAEQVDFDVDRFIEDNEILELPGDPGWRLHALHTPGHDPGHLAFYEETTRTVLCGDLIANPGTIVVSEAYGGNMDDFIASLERVEAIEEATLVLPSHGLAEREPPAIFRKHIEHRLWRENKIREAYEAGNRELQSLLETAYDDAPKEALPLAEHSMRAHLKRLGIVLEE